MKAVCRSRGSLLLRLTASLRRTEHTQVSGGPQAPVNVKQNYDASKYGGWKSAKMLFTEVPEKPSLIGRWDWHVVQFLLALVPPGMVLLLVQWAQYDMGRRRERLEQEAQAEMQEQFAATAAAVTAAAARAAPADGSSSSSSSTSSADASQRARFAAERGSSSLQDRIAQLESMVAALQAREAGREAAAGKEETSSSKTVGSTTSSNDGGTASSSSSSPGPSEHRAEAAGGGLSLEDLPRRPVGLRQLLTETPQQLWVLMQGARRWVWTGSVRQAGVGEQPELGSPDKPAIASKPEP